MDTHPPLRSYDADGSAFGEFLRRARERRGLTLQQIANETKIPQRHLDALERGNLSVIPRGIYQRAEIRAFAQTVGLDQKLALAELERALEASATLEATPQSRKRPRGRLRSRELAVITVATSLIGVVWAIALVNRQPIQGVTQAVWSSVPGVAQDVVRTSPSTSPSMAPVIEREVVVQEPAPPGVVEGELVVTSEPAGARVTVNGVGWGVTPLTIRHLPLGANRIRLTLEGYAGEERLVPLAAESPIRSVHVPFRVQQ